jgi:hypothetical protein
MDVIMQETEDGNKENSKVEEVEEENVEDEEEEANVISQNNLQSWFFHVTEKQIVPFSVIFAFISGIFVIILIFHMTVYFIVNFFIFYFFEDV